MGKALKLGFCKYCGFSQLINIAILVLVCLFFSKQVEKMESKLDRIETNIVTELERVHDDGKR